MELLLSLGWTLVFGIGLGFATEMRRGPHHPRDSPLPPGVPHPKHYRPSDTLDKLTHDKELLRDVTHIQEDIGRPIEDMSDEELEFYYFKLHDFDSNTLLDGLEMLKAIFHTMEHDHGDKGEDSDDPKQPTPEEMERYIELIDKVLEEDDVDKDGYISYPEFAMGKLDAKSKHLSSKKH